MWNFKKHQQINDRFTINKYNKKYLIWYEYMKKSSALEHQSYDKQT